MNSKQKREEIVALINNIKEHSDRLTHMPHMPLLEVSAILSKINRLHESTVVLKYLLATEQHHEDEEFGLSFSKMELLEEEELEEEDDDPLDATLEEDTESVDDYDDDADQDDDLVVDEESIDLSAEFEQGSVSATASETVVIQKEIEEISEESGISSKADINEQYAEEVEDKSVSDQLKKQPISDLMAAIGLNERYLYANDLFGGDMEEFRKVIGHLNEFSDASEATEYFNSDLRKNYDWEEDNELAEALFQLMKRRF